MEKQTFNISELPVYVIDGQISTGGVNSFYEVVQTLAFVKGEKDFDGDVYPIFSVDFDQGKFEAQTLIGQKSRELMKEIYPDLDYKLFRVYINLSNYGDMEFPHRDCGLEEKNITVLYYVNKVWDFKWGGETIFYENDESKQCVLPRPGRFLIFAGAVQHIGSIATRICTESRLTLALKYKLKKK